jgi:hypothetical protein
MVSSSFSLQAAFLHQKICMDLCFTITAINELLPPSISKLSPTGEKRLNKSAILKV